MMEVVAVCISEKKGERKHPVPGITLQCGHGIVGDAHAGNWHRQVSLLADESVETMRALGMTLAPGDFAENILTRGIELKTLTIGTRLRVGGTVLKSRRSASSVTTTAPLKRPPAAASCRPRAYLPSCWKRARSARATRLKFWRQEDETD